MDTIRYQKGNPMSENNNSFLDSKTVMAIVFMAVLWFAWDAYMRNKYPHTYKNNQQQEEKKDVSRGDISKKKNFGISENGAQTWDRHKQTENKPVKEEQVKESLYQYESNWLSFTMTSKGMGIYDVILEKYTDRQHQPMKLGKRSHFTLFETNLIGKTLPLDFSVEKVGENKFVGQAFHGPMTITKEFFIDPITYTVFVNVEVSDIRREFLGLTTYLSEHIEEAPKSSFLMPSFGGQEVFTLNAEGQNRIFVSDLDESSNSHKGLQIAAVGTQYFAQAILDKSDVIPSAIFFKDEGSIIGRLNHSLLNRSSEFSITYMGFVGPKSSELLESLDPNLASLVDFGWFHWVGKFLLRLLKVFYGLSGNWGVAIILMTILVRLLLLPLNVFSYKSMKKMQIIQPEIKAIREKHKGGDAQKMNLEVMALMRENKANPLSGCLPMLLQFPIFIALYRVLGQSVELYQAPFVFWIQDLSLKDSFYILPILMGLSMFVQMKIQPNTMEEAQRRIMMLMPILFTFFMLSLPSGLTLYILVSTLFGIGQHFCFMREPTKAPVPTT